MEELSTLTASLLLGFGTAIGVVAIATGLFSGKGTFSAGAVTGGASVFSGLTCSAVEETSSKKPK